MNELAKWARAALMEVLAFLRRLISNTPRDDYEAIIIGAARAVVVRYGRF